MAALKLIGVFLKVNLQIALAYRADTVVNILINIMWLGWELLGLRIIFSNTDTLAGWGPGAADHAARRVPADEPADGGGDLAGDREIQHQRARRIARLHAPAAGQQPVPGQLFSNRRLEDLGPGAGSDPDRGRDPDERRHAVTPPAWPPSSCWRSQGRW